MAKDFTKKYSDIERPEFIVGGQTFTARAKLPYKRFSTLLEQMRADDVDVQAATAEFFRTALIREDRDRFIELLEYDGDDDDVTISMEQLNEITDWLMEHFTGKTQPSSDSSPNGAGGTGQSRKVVSLSSRAG